MKPTTGAAPLLIMLYIAGASLIGLFVVKPKIFHGESKRAENSAKTTADLVAAGNQKSAEAAASVATIGKANADAPESPQKAFIAREVPVAAALLEKPDQSALIASEQRMRAVLEGKLEQADKLYGLAAQRSADLEAKYVGALAAKQKADIELQISAAEHLAAERQRNQLLVVCFVFGLLYVYTKSTHLGIGAVTELAMDIKSGEVSPEHALDAVTSRFQQSLVRFLKKFKK